MIIKLVSRRYFIRPAPKLLLVAALLLPLTACVHQTTQIEAEAALQLPTEVMDCRAMLAADLPEGDGFDGSSIRVLTWNVHKTRKIKWREDFEAFGGDADLVLMQEASLREATIADLDSSMHWSFAPGYRKRGEVTGVMTLSSIKPLTQCSFAHAEPWLRTPKATSVTQYGLSGTDQSLVVVNLHAVNFSLGTSTFRKQFEQVRQVLENHQGPVILSGDLNTWSQKRTRIVNEIAESLGLHEVLFMDDHRVTVFGNKLDHIYVRGLHATDARTPVVDSSDHNPMIAVFSL